MRGTKSCSWGRILGSRTKRFSGEGTVGGTGGRGIERNVCREEKLYGDDRDVASI